MSERINILFGSDHGGFEMKNGLIEFCRVKGWQHHDVGCFTSESCDYPIIAKDLCKKYIGLNNSDKINYGVLICKSGIGMSIAANRIPSIHAALVHNKDDAKLSRLHNNANILVLSANQTKIETAKAMLQVFVETQFLTDRHLRRINIIDA